MNWIKNNLPVEALSISVCLLLLGITIMVAPRTPPATRVHTFQQEYQRGLLDGYERAKAIYTKEYVKLLIDSIERDSPTSQPIYRIGEMPQSLNVTEYIDKAIEAKIMSLGIRNRRPSFGAWFCDVVKLGG